MALKSGGRMAAAAAGVGGKGVQVVVRKRER